MAALDHEGTRTDQPAHLSVVEGIAQIEFLHLVLGRQTVAIWLSERRHLACPVTVVGRAAQQAVALEQGGILIAAKRP